MDGACEKASFQVPMNTADCSSVDWFCTGVRVRVLGSLMLLFPVFIRTDVSSHSASLAFRHSSSKLCRNLSRHWTGTFYLHASVYRNFSHNSHAFRAFVKFAVSLRTLRLWEQHGAKARTSTSGESATGKKKISVSIPTALVLFMLA